MFPKHSSEKSTLPEMISPSALQTTSVDNAHIVINLTNMDTYISLKQTTERQEIERNKISSSGFNSDSSRILRCSLLSLVAEVSDIDMLKEKTPEKSTTILELFASPKKPQGRSTLK